MLCGSFTNVSHLLVTRWGHSEYLEPSLVEINLHRILNSFSISTAIAHTQKHSSNGSIIETSPKLSPTCINLRATGFFSSESCEIFLIVVFFSSQIDPLNFRAPEIGLRCE